MKTLDRVKLLSICASQEGYKEDPPNSNFTKYNDWYYGRPRVAAPWCCTSVSWVFDQAGTPLPKIQSDGVSGAAYVPYVYDFYKKWSTPGKSKFTTTPKPGDIVIYDWNGDKIGDHIGIYIDWNLSGKSLHAWEGNTSPTSDSNGGEYMKRLRYVSNVLCFIDSDLAI